MKRIIGVVVCLVPLAAYGQQRYTNEDLRKFSVPGAYTNQDLKKLPPVPVVGKAAPAHAPRSEAPEVDSESFQIALELLAEQRSIYQAELDWRNQEIERAYSFFDKGPEGYPRPGYLSKSRGVLQYLEMQIAIMDERIAAMEEDAYSAGAVIERP
jgi:hypothetical protein